MIICGMVVTGTARSVGVKIFYQLGSDNNPLFIALLYLVGQSMALLVYGARKRCGYETTTQHEEDTHDYTRVVLKDESDAEYNTELTVTDDEDEHSDELMLSQTEAQQPGESRAFDLCPSAPSTNESDESEHLAAEFELPPLSKSQSLPIPLESPSPPTSPANRRRRKRRGSKTGLIRESQDAVAWVHYIPWQLKPLIPGLLNLANAAFKWSSFVFVAASVAEMLMSGLEVVLSTIVARVVRKRQISAHRWTGVGVVAVGLAAVHAADLLDATTSETTDTNNDNDESRRDHWIGAALIVGQCVTAVGQDIAEELFLQETDFPATLLLGMEGIFGLIFGVPLYLKFSPETPQETLTNLRESEWQTFYLCILVMVFTVTGIFNIMTTGVTSSMTRNMWKNCRTLLVWVVGLVIFYSIGDDTLGEEWIVPDSFFILGGFLTMLGGIFIYYKSKSLEQ